MIKEVYRRRQAILRATRQSVIRYGLRAFRVEEVAGMLAMSKRTIYRLFPTKSDLLKACVADMGLHTRLKIDSYLRGEYENPFLNLLDYLREYIDCLYQVESIFLLELKQLPDFQEVYLANRHEWSAGMEQLITACQKRNYILAGVDIPLFSKRLLTALYESRLDGIPQEGQFAFGSTLLRGISSYAGIDCIEKSFSLK